MKSNRRNFLTTAFGAIGIGLVTLMNRSANAKKLRFSYDKLGSLKKVGGSALVSIKDREVLLVRDTEWSIKALNPKCTHRGCRVRYNQSESKIECSCDGAWFDLNGRVLRGPATAPLEVFPTTMVDRQLIVDVSPFVERTPKWWSM